MNFHFLANLLTRKRTVAPQLPDLGDAVRVVIISPEYLDEKYRDDPTSGSLAVGITKQRAEELYMASLDALKTSKTMIEAQVAVSAQCKHPNELAFAITMMCLSSEKMRQTNTLIEMLGLRR